MAPTVAPVVLWRKKPLGSIPDCTIVITVLAKKSVQSLVGFYEFCDDFAHILPNLFGCYRTGRGRQKEYGDYPKLLYKLDCHARLFTR